MRQTSALAAIRTFIVDIVRRFSFDSLAMYTLALASELPVILVRATLLYMIIGLKLAIQGHGDDPPVLWLEVGLFPALWSILALASPYGTAWWWKQRSGGREPSQREQLAYNDSVDLLQAQTRDPLPLPGNWFVIDTPTPDAAVCGETLMLSRGLMESDHLPAVLAHELGHLATPDGKLTAAINRLVLIPPRPPRHEQANHEPADEPRPGIEIRNERSCSHSSRSEPSPGSSGKHSNSSTAGSDYGSQARYGGLIGASESTRQTPTPHDSAKQTS